MTAAMDAQARTAGRGQPALFDHTLHRRVALPVCVLLLAFPPLMSYAGADFYVGVANRVLVFALAATSLNLILGCGGMISFGHAAFLGVGGYTVAILMQGGVASAMSTWLAAMLAGGGCAAVIGAISLRTRGVYFIMITLALAQMLYYLVIALPTFGGEDGIPLARRATLAGIDLAADHVYFYVLLAIDIAALSAVARLLNSRFGHALQGIRENETRMAALGYPVYRYKLVAFTLAGALAGLAGALLANQNGMIAPASMHWSQSGMLMVMVILGGVGRLYGGLLGAAALLVAEELLQALTIHWQFGLGAVLLAVVLLAPRGLAALFGARRS